MADASGSGAAGSGGRRGAAGGSGGSADDRKYEARAQPLEMNALDDMWLLRREQPVGRAISALSLCQARDRYEVVRLQPRNIRRFMHAAREQLSAREEEGVSEEILRRVKLSVDRQVGTDAFRLAKEAVADLNLEAKEQTKLLKKMDKRVLKLREDAIQHGGSSKHTTPDEVREELQALGSESHSIEERMNQLVDAAIRAWEYFVSYRPVVVPPAGAGTVPTIDRHHYAEAIKWGMFAEDMPHHWAPRGGAAGAEKHFLTRNRHVIDLLRTHPGETTMIMRCVKLGWLVKEILPPLRPMYRDKLMYEGNDIDNESKRTPVDQKNAVPFNAAELGCAHILNVTVYYDKKNFSRVAGALGFSPDWHAMPRDSFKLALEAYDTLIAKAMIDEHHINHASPREIVRAIYDLHESMGARIDSEFYRALYADHERFPNDKEIERSIEISEAFASVRDWSFFDEISPDKQKELKQPASALTSVAQFVQSHFITDHIEFYRDLDDAIKGVPMASTKNRAYRMMAGRARPPIIEFGVRGRWYLGSRATKRCQAVEMCLKLAEAVVYDKASVQRMGADKRYVESVPGPGPTPTFEDFARALPAGGTGDDLRNLVIRELQDAADPKTRVRDFLLDGTSTTVYYYCAFLRVGLLLADYVSIQIMANYYGFCFVVDNDVFIPFEIDEASAITIRIPSRGYEWRSGELQVLNDAEIESLLRDISTEYQPPRDPPFSWQTAESPDNKIDETFTISPKRAARWWLRYYDGWAVSTMADNHAVQNAGLSVMSSVYLSEMLPYLLQQHRALWCPRAKNAYDRHFANVLYLLTNYRAAKGKTSKPKKSIGDDLAHDNDCILSLRALYPDCDWVETDEPMKFTSMWNPQLLLPANKPRMIQGTDIRTNKPTVQGIEAWATKLDMTEDGVRLAAYKNMTVKGRYTLAFTTTPTILGAEDLGAWTDAMRAATSDVGQTQRLLRAMAVIDDQEGTIAAAMRAYVRTECGQESLCVAQNFTEVTPRFAAARAMVIEAVNHLWAYKAPPGDPPAGFSPAVDPEIFVAAGPVGYNEEWMAEAIIVRTRMFAPAMISAGAILAHERYSAGYSDPRGLSSATKQFDRAVSAIAGELNKRRRR